MQRLLTVLGSLSFLAIGLWSVVNVHAYAPAFNPALRETGILEDWRVTPSHAMYDQGEYLLQLSQGYLNADFLISNATGAEDEVADPDVARAWASRAFDLSTTGAEVSPANTHIWQSVAWAGALSGNIDAARFAMARSAQLAPHHLELSYNRLAFYSLIAADAGRTTPPLTQSEIDALNDDIETLDTFDTGNAALVRDQEEFKNLVAAPEAAE